MTIQNTQTYTLQASKKEKSREREEGVLEEIMIEYILTLFFPFHFILFFSLFFFREAVTLKNAESKEFAYTINAQFSLLTLCICVLLLLQLMKLYYYNYIITIVYSLHWGSCLVQSYGF